MLPAIVSALAPYGAVLIAATVEGEITYIGALTLVARGQLSAVGVLLAGTAGAALGDQAYFYAFRGRLPRWIARYPSLQKKAAPLVERVRRHDSFMVLLIRFAPGFRIAIAAACAWAEVSPKKFSLLNLLSAFVWASALLVLVGWFGPTYLSQLGLGGWTGAVVTAVVAFALLKLVGSIGRRAMQRADAP
jgi:membrane protein DedA with SNARE-associated domain